MVGLSAWCNRRRGTSKSVNLPQFVRTKQTNRASARSDQVGQVSFLRASYHDPYCQLPIFSNGNIQLCGRNLVLTASDTVKSHNVVGREDKHRPALCTTYATSLKDCTASTPTCSVGLFFFDVIFHWSSAYPVQRRQTSRSDHMEITAGSLHLCLRSDARCV
jgi:hypothetical protein